MRLIFSIALALTLVSSSASAETLADALRKYGLKSLPSSVKTDVPITSYAVLDDPRTFAIGYYEVDPKSPDYLNPPLHVVLYDRNQDRWSTRSYSQMKASTVGERDECFGSILQFQRSGPNYLVITHLNPSASCTVILSPTLNMTDVSYGWPAASFASGRLVIQRSEIHFASTHPLELDLYDPANRSTTPLLPLAGDQVRAAIVADLRAKRDLNWCRENNASCDPERLEGNLQEIKMDDRTRTAALKVKYESYGFGPDAEKSVGDADVIYVFDLSGAKPRFRSYRQDVFKKTFGTTQLEEILKPSVLKRIFAD